MARDLLQSAREDYSDAKDAVREQYERIREDFRFSNPAQPEQWDAQTTNARKGRPMHTLDRTNQFVQHVVNRHRESKASADILPADSKADVEVAKQIKGIIRHIEYVSRADIAWDTASDHQARGGLGWVRVLPKIVNPETNEQEIIIQRVHDPLSCVLDPNSTEPDGSDAMFGFAESTLTNKAFDRMYPKAKKSNFDSEGWFADNSVRIAEYFKVTETKYNQIVIEVDGSRMTASEDDYWKIAGQIGFKPNVIEQFVAKKRVVKWCKLTGLEILEETIFPAQWIGIVPVIGHEMWLDGKRYLCGLVRRLMDGQRLHNYEMSALTESLMSQPKAPFLVSGRAVDGREEEWQRLNSGNPAYLTYNDLDDAGQPINQPIRLSPPNFPVAYANSANLAVQEMEAAVGMYKATFGQQSNAISGRAKIADKEAGETATYHFLDNRRVAQQQVYRIVVDMLPTIYDASRQAKIMGEDGEQSTVQINPDMDTAAQRVNGKLVAINPGVGRYDVRVKIGPSYTTIREEMGVKLQELGKGNPVLASALLPVMMKLADMPEADRIARVAIAMLPPEVQQAYHEEDMADMPAAAKAQITEQGQQIQQMAGAMEQAAKVIEDLQSQVNDKNEAVQDEAKAAMAEIKAAQQELKHQADAIKAQERELADAKRIAMLELQLQQTSEQSSSEQPAAKPQSEPQKIIISSNEEELTTLTALIQRTQEAMAQALQQNAQINAQTQALVVDAIEDMADAMSAPRKIQLQKGSDGRTIGATSVAVMPEGEDVISDE